MRKTTTHGFTLIEMVVTIGLIAVLVGGAIAAFVRFNDGQQTLKAARMLQETLRSAQLKARSKETAGLCTSAAPLQAYRLYTAGGAGAAVYLLPMCAANKLSLSNPSPLPAAAFTVPSTVTLPALRIDYFTLAGGADTNGVSTVTVTGFSGARVATFSISNSGQIGEVVKVQ